MKIKNSQKNQRKDFFGAIQEFNKAIEINPKDDKAYNNLAVALY